MLAEDGVTVTFPLPAGSGSLLDLLPNDQTNRTTRTAQPDQKVNITAQTFRLHDRLAVFAGNVETPAPADGSEPRMHCAELEVRLGEDKKPESLQARQKVVCERGIVRRDQRPEREDLRAWNARRSPPTRIRPLTSCLI